MGTNYWSGSKAKFLLDELEFKSGSTVKGIGSDGVSLPIVKGFSEFGVITPNRYGLSTFTASGGSFALETVSPLSGDSSFKWSPTAVSQTLTFPSISMPLRTRNKVGKSPIGITIHNVISHSGLRLEVLDQASNVLASSIALSAGNKPIFVPLNPLSTSTNLVIRLTCDVYTASMNIVFDDVVFDDEPFRKIDTIEQNHVIYTGYTSVSSTRIKFTTEASKSNSFISIDNSTFTKYTFNRECDFQASTSVNVSGSNVNIGLELYNSSNTLKYRSYGDIGLTGASSASLNTKAEVGDYLQVTISGGTVQNNVSTNFSVTAQAINDSVVIENADGAEWTSWTPTGSWVTNTTYSGKWRRNGQNFEAEVLLSLTGAPTAATLTVNIPYTIDSSIVLGGGDDVNLGLATIVDSGTGRYQGRVGYNTTSDVIVRWSNVSGANIFPNPINATSPVTFANGDKIILRFSVPIQGWSATQAHIMDIADPYENRFSVYCNSAGVKQRESESGTFTTSYNGSGLYTFNYSSLGLTQPPASVSAQGGNPILRVQSVTATSCQVYSYNYISGTPEASDVFVEITLSSADYREPKGYFIGQSVPMRTAYIKDVKSTGVAGQSIPDDAWTTRELTSVSGDSSFVSLSSNQFTLGAGTYDIEWVSPQVGGGIGTTRLRNITDSTDSGQGSTVNSSAFCESKGFVRVEITSSKTFAIQHYLNAGAVSGGSALNLASYSEIYTQVKIVKVK